MKGMLLLMSGGQLSSPTPLNTGSYSSTGVYATGYTPASPLANQYQVVEHSNPRACTDTEFDFTLNAIVPVIYMFSSFVADCTLPHPLGHVEYIQRLLDLIQPRISFPIIFLKLSSEIQGMIST